MRWYRAMRRRRRRPTSVTKHYLAHKEATRALVCSRLEHFNAHYGFAYNRVSIRNQRRCWGSCTSLKNLNFSYRLLFLPPELADYVIVHELCHLKELNHSPRFWALVAEALPHYRDLRRELKEYERSVATARRGRYPSGTTMQAMLQSGAAPTLRQSH